MKISENIYSVLKVQQVFFLGQNVKVNSEKKWPFGKLCDLFFKHRGIF